MAEIFNRHRAESALCLHGKTPRDERRDKLKTFSRGEFQYLCNCGLFLEGFDETSIGVVAMARALGLEVLAKGLLEYETLSGDEIRDLLNGKRPRRESTIEPAAPRTSAVPTAGKPRPRPETGGMEPQPQA